MAKRTSQTQELFHRVFVEKGRMTWPNDLKKAYIKAVASQNQLNQKQLPANLVDQPEEVVFERMSQYDRSLRTFLDFYQLYEALGTKRVGIYHLRKLSPQDRTAVLDSSKDQPYEFAAHDDWTVTSSMRVGRKVLLTLSKVALQPVKATLRKSDFNEATWNAIRDTARERLHGGEALLEVKATITAEKRAIVTVQVDLEGNVLEVGSDVFQASSEGTKLNDEQIRSDRRAALQVVGEHFALSRPGVHSLVASTEDDTPIIRKTTNDGLEKVNDEELLIVRTMERYRAENAAEERLTEDAEISLPNQDLRDILSNAADFYDAKGTFEGFFEDHPEHQTEDAKYIRELRDSGAPITRAKAYAICIRSAEPYEESKHKRELAGRLIDYIGFDIDLQKGETEIRNGRYSRRAQRAFLDRLIRLDKGDGT